MLEKKKVKNYTKLLAEKHGLPEKTIHKIIMYGMKNIIKIIKEGQDIRIPGFGHIYFDKKNYSKYIKKIKKSKQTNL